MRAVQIWMTTEPNIKLENQSQLKAWSAHPLACLCIDIKFCFTCQNFGWQRTSDENCGFELVESCSPGKGHKVWQSRQHNDQSVGAIFEQRNQGQLGGRHELWGAPIEIPSWDKFPCFRQSWLTQMYQSFSQCKTQTYWHLRVYTGRPDSIDISENPLTQLFFKGWSYCNISIIFLSTKLFGKVLAPTFAISRSASMSSWPNPKQTNWRCSMRAAKKSSQGLTHQVAFWFGSFMTSHLLTVYHWSRWKWPRKLGIAKNSWRTRLKHDFLERKHCDIHDFALPNASLPVGWIRQNPWTEFTTSRDQEFT